MILLLGGKMLLTQRLARRSLLICLACMLLALSCAKKNWGSYGANGNGR